MNKFNSGDVPSILIDSIPEELIDFNEKEKNDHEYKNNNPFNKQKGRPKKNLNSDIVYRPNEFYGYTPNCKTCQMASQDIKINEIYYENRKVSEVWEYIKNKYPRYPSYNSVLHHCKNHLVSTESNQKRELQKYNDEINSYIKKVKEMNDNDEVNKLKAIIMKNLEKIDSLEFKNDPTMFFESRKVINGTLKAYIECKNFELKRAGVGATAEELENRVKTFCLELIENIIKNEDATRANEIIQIIQKNMPTNL